MEPEPYWKLAILDTLYTWLSAELLNYAHVNLPLDILGIPFVCLFDKFWPLYVNFSGVFLDYRYFPHKSIFLSSDIQIHL